MGVHIKQPRWASAEEKMKWPQGCVAISGVLGRRGRRGCGDGEVRGRGADFGLVVVVVVAAVMTGEEEEDLGAVVKGRGGGEAGYSCVTNPRLASYARHTRSASSESES